MSGEEGAGRLQRARALLDLGRPEQAAALLAEALAEEPGNAEAWCAMARCRYSQRDYQGCLEATGQALVARPGMVVAWRFRALALIELEQWEEAWNAAGEAVRLEPEHWYGHMLVAKVLLANTSGRFHEEVAGPAAARARELAPHEPDTHFTIGLVFDRSNRPAEAEQSYREALRLAPEHRGARNQLALIQMRRGDNYGAVQGFAAVAATGEGAFRAGEHNLRVVTVRLIAPARWISLGSFFLSEFLVESQSTSGWPARIVCLAVVAAAWTVWLLWAVRQVPQPLRQPLLRSGRASRYVGLTLAGVSALTLAALALLLVPPLAGQATAVLVVGIVVQLAALSAARRAAEQERAALRG
ncbi:tetratricopeptide repeat protein [Streptacidiphilus sp. 4-A2]|nr:tetratricopeptide repeat protein [Streptacidiphilus sp. 4-A2]